MPGSMYNWFLSASSIFSGSNLNDPEQYAIQHHRNQSAYISSWSFTLAALFGLCEHKCNENSNYVTTLLAIAGGGLVGAFIGYKDANRNQLTFTDTHSSEGNTLSGEPESLTTQINTHIENLSKNIPDLEADNIRRLLTWASNYNDSSDEINSDTPKEESQQKLLVTIEKILSNQVKKADTDSSEIIKFWAYDLLVLQDSIKKAAFTVDHAPDDSTNITP